VPQVLGLAGPAHGADGHRDLLDAELAALPDHRLSFPAHDGIDLIVGGTVVPLGAAAEGERGKRRKRKG
jgi:hypothetical protein